MHPVNGTYDVSSPIVSHYAITPADTDLAIVPRCLWVGGAGTLVVTDNGGTVVTYVNISGLLPIRPIRIAAASTATDIIGMY